MAEFQNQSILFGIGGLDLKRTLDLIDIQKLARMTNVRRVEDGALTTRAGLGPVDVGNLDSNFPVHSLFRGSVPFTDEAYLIAASDTNVYWGEEGSLFAQAMEVPTTGIPLTFVPARPAATNDTYLYFGDENIVPAGNLLGYLAMRKLQLSTGEISRMGVVDAGSVVFGGFPVTSTIAAAQEILIDDFETAIPPFVDNAGTGLGPSNNIDPVNFRAGVASTQLNSNPPAVAQPYYNFWSKPKTVNLSVFPDTTPVTDDDFMHFWISADYPDRIEEIRIYFVINNTLPTLSLVDLPGISPTVNTDAYVYSLRPDEFDPIAAGTWLEFGTLGLPLRRGAFVRMGTISGLSWATVNALVVMVSVKENLPVVVRLDDMYMFGGAGLDSSLPGAQKYDFRYTHFDPATGDEGNPSAIQVNEIPNMFPLDALRQPIDLQPFAYGIATFRQKFYRRGGTLNNNWYYDGMNSSDGGAYQSTATDIALQNSATLDIDNDFPITTVDDAGVTWVNQPLPVLFGPVNDIMLGVGDAMRPGFMYWSKPGKYGAWPAAYNIEVCSPTEELMTGFVAGTQPYIFSRAQLYAATPDFSNSAIMTVNPTQCNKGILTRWAFCLVPGGVAFVSKDGVEFSPGPGGPAQSLSDDAIYHLFHGDDGAAKNGYYPIDFSAEALPYIRMTFHDGELWLAYRATLPDFNGLLYGVMVYNWTVQNWRHYDFFQGDISYGEGIIVANLAPASFFSDWGRPGDPTNHQGTRLLMGAVASGFISEMMTGGPEQDQQHVDFINNWAQPHSPIPPPRIRTGALDQGLPRINKLYGDAFVDIDTNGIQITVTPYANTESLVLTPTIINGNAGRERYYISINDVLARNLSLDFTWTPQADPAELYPIIYQGGISYIAQPDTTEYRVTDWDNQGRLSDKWVKGVLIECNTFGVEKTIELQADGEAKQQIKVKTDGRQIVQFSFPEYLGRVLRFRPTDNVQWMLYEFRWIFDEEPLALLRWESQELTHGLVGWQKPLFAQIALKSNQVVVLTVRSMMQNGRWFDKSYSIPSTMGIKQLKFVPFQATKGVQFKYLFNGGASPFWLYREESEVTVQPWQGGGHLTVKPFGNDDLDLTRSMVDAAAAAGRSGLANR